MPTTLRTVLVALAISFLAYESVGQVLSPGESALVIPTAESRTDARLTIGYGQLPNEVSSPSGGRFKPARYRDEVYVITLQFIPRVTLHYRQSFKVGGTGIDRVLGVHATLVREGQKRPGVSVGIRDASGTRRHHASYVVMTKGLNAGPLRPALTLGYSKHVLDAGFLEMKDGAFYGFSISAWHRTEFMLEYDTRFHYAGVRLWPLKWVWVTGFVAEWEHPGFAFGISRALYGSKNHS